LTESSVTVQDALKELDESVKQGFDEAEERRKAASAKNENYKLEYSAGEKKAYENISKTIKTILGKL
jgi:F0F1-type ATP synthase membrane subunit b/b'